MNANIDSWYDTAGRRKKGVIRKWAVFDAQRTVSFAAESLESAQAAQAAANIIAEQSAFFAEQARLSAETASAALVQANHAARAAATAHAAAVALADLHGYE